MNIYQEIANLYATQVEIYRILYATQVEIYRMKCKICNKAINDNTGYIHPDGCHYHDKCKPLPIPPMPQAPPKMCHKCDLPIYVSNTKKWPDGFYYHDMCSVDSDPPKHDPMCVICHKTLSGYEQLTFVNYCKDHSHYANLPPVPQHIPGAKLDHDKPRLGLVLGNFSRALMQVGKVGTMGAKKYTPNGWIKVENGVDRYTDAMVRHYLTEETGEKFDPELSEMAGEDIYHAACVAWNALARLELMIRNKELEMDKQ